VIVVGRNAERGAETVQEITETGGHARFIPANLDNPNDIQALALEVGDIDVLVNNAGHAVWGPTDELKVEQFDSMFASNVRGPYFLVAAFPRPAPATSPAPLSLSTAAAPPSDAPNDRKDPLP
jgi:NAD(P)-dependent dehydrogenase (short-subunit alcohol dehydrogenase family)